MELFGFFFSLFVALTKLTLTQLVVVAAATCALHSGSEGKWSLAESK